MNLRAIPFISHRRVHPKSTCFAARRAHQSAVKNYGFSYIELMLAVTIAALLMAGLGGVVSQALQSQSVVQEKNQLTREARFAMQQMVRNIRFSRHLILPLNDNPATDWPENIREQTVPASPPIGSSTLATAVLAITLPSYVDLDDNGLPDIDDDGDGLVDEDLPNDTQHDFANGIMLIDDDGDGSIDEGSGWYDDDEDGVDNEDPIDGIDNDGDGSIDEDPPTDNNADGCAGICGVDDDADGSIDESGSDDDDEQGGGFEDPHDPVVFYLNGNQLIERMPVPWDTDGISVPDGPVDGRDWVESTIAENVTRFRVERLPAGNSSAQLIDLTLELTSPISAETVSLHTQVRLGGGL